MIQTKNGSLFYVKIEGTNRRLNEIENFNDKYIWNNFYSERLRLTRTKPKYCTKNKVREI
jgi:hypothetical protein